MITFAKTLVDRFRHNNKSLRYGQAFYNYAKLHKVDHPQDKEFCDRLFNADDDKAKQMIISRTDLAN
jgi:hypothetical protein